MTYRLDHSSQYHRTGDNVKTHWRFYITDTYILHYSRIVAMNDGNAMMHGNALLLVLTVCINVHIKEQNYVILSSWFVISHVI